MEGYVHSFESLAAVDGEGLRCAVFLSGCPLRCVYCHNPDTWHMTDSQKTSAKSLAQKIARYKPYFGNDGGVTFSGGEPLLQADFINEVAKYLNEYNIGYVIDTSGAVELTDSVKRTIIDSQLVILDLKFWDDLSYREYAKSNIAPVLETLDYLESIKKNTWIRTVVVPEINDSEQILELYLPYIQGKTCVKKYELLAFHTMGFFKYDNLGICNKLSKTKALEPTLKQSLQNFVNSRLAL